MNNKSKLFQVRKEHSSVGIWRFGATSQRPCFFKNKVLSFKKGHPSSVLLCCYWRAHLVFPSSILVSKMPAFAPRTADTHMKFHGPKRPIKQLKVELLPIPAITSKKKKPHEYQNLKIPLTAEPFTLTPVLFMNVVF